jgi:hypothetical protein
MGDLGEVIEVVIVEPVESPIPAEKTPEPVEVPITEPERERVGA